MKSPRFAVPIALTGAFISCVLTTAEPTPSYADRLRKDVVYRTVGGVDLKLDAYVPEGDGPFPTAILVHGGGFVRGDKQSYITPLFEPLSRAGYAWFTIDYRLAPGHRWPACAEDVRAAIAWVKQHAKEYKVDAGRIALIGESAGGHLVSYVGTQRTEETTVAAVVPFYAPHDLVFQNEGQAEPGPSMKALLGLETLDDAAKAKLREVSATTYIKPGLPPYLLITGDADAQVPAEQSRRFHARMAAAGNDCTLIVVPGGAHGMGSWRTLGSDYQARMIAWLNTKLSAGTAPTTAP